MNCVCLMVMVWVIGYQKNVSQLKFKHKAAGYQ